MAFFKLFEETASDPEHASHAFNFRGIFRRVNTELNYKITFQEFSNNLITPYVAPPRDKQPIEEIIFQDLRAKR